MTYTNGVLLPTSLGIDGKMAVTQHPKHHDNLSNEDGLFLDQK